MRLGIQQFSAVVTEFQVREAKAAGSEKRSVTRIAIHAPIEAAVYDGMFSRLFTMLCRDISLEGIGLMTGVAFQSGQNLVAKLLTCHGPPIYVLCAVMHCRVMAENIFVLGCRFASMLNEQQVRDLENHGEDQMRRARQSILS